MQKESKVEEIETRQRLIDCAYEEIYTKGFQGASINDILKNAGVNKGSMYHFFGSKKELAIAAITEKMNKRFGERYEAIALGEGSYLAGFMATLKDLSLRDFRRGCPLANLVQEMSNLDSDFDAALKAIYISFKNSIKAILDRAVLAGEMRECDTDKLARFIIHVLEGAIMGVKASGSEREYLDTIELLEQYLEKLA